MKQWQSVMYAMGTIMIERNQMLFGGTLNITANTRNVHKFIVLIFDIIVSKIKFYFLRLKQQHSMSSL